MNNPLKHKLYSTWDEPDLQLLGEAVKALRQGLMDEAQSKFIILSESKSLLAEVYTGRMISDGTWRQNGEPEVALIHYERSAERGLPTAQYFAGRERFEQADYDRSIYWFQKAMEAGLLPASYWLSLTYRRKAGAENVAKADELLTMSADGGHLFALRDLGRRQMKDGKSLKIYLAGLIKIMRAAVTAFFISNDNEKVEGLS